MPMMPPARAGRWARPAPAPRRRQLAEGLLHRVGVDRDPREAELVDDRGAEDAGPAEHEAVRVDRLVAEGRGAGAVDDPAERARGWSGRGRCRCSGAKTLSSWRGAQVEPAEERSESSIELGAGGSSCWRPAGWAAAGGRRSRRRTGSMRLAGIDVAREGLAGERVADGVGEDPRALVDRGHAREARDAARDARALVVDEEEGLVLDDRAAEVAAELVLVVGRLGTARAPLAAEPR